VAATELVEAAAVTVQVALLATAVMVRQVFLLLPGGSSVSTLREQHGKVSFSWQH
jgi:hypothetical protein